MPVAVMNIALLKIDDPRSSNQFRKLGRLIYSTDDVD